MNIVLLLNGAETEFYMPLTVTDDQRGSAQINVPHDLDVSRGDQVEIRVDGETIFRGEVAGVTIRRGQGIKILNCRGRNSILYQRYVLDADHHAYTSMDAGAIAKDLIDFYFAGVLTSNNIDTSTGTTISAIDGWGKTVGEFLEELAERAGCAFYVDWNDDVHFFPEGGEESGLTIDEEDVFDVEVDMNDEVVRRVIVHGRGGVTGSAGSGMPERYFRDRRISSASEAAEVAQAILNKYGASRRSARIETAGLFGLRAGQTVTVNLPRDGFNGSSEIVRRVSWIFGGGKASTTITVGDFDFTDNPLEWALRRVWRGLRIKQDDYELSLAEQSGSLDDVADGASYRRVSAGYVDASARPVTKEAEQMTDGVVTVPKTVSTLGTPSGVYEITDPSAAEYSTLQTTYQKVFEPQSYEGIDGVKYAIRKVVVKMRGSSYQPTETSDRDSYIDSGHPDTNYGSNTTAIVGLLGSQPVRGLFGFDLPSDISQAAQVVSATLRLYQNNQLGEPGERTFYAQRITESWTEDGVTWNTQPAATTTNQASLTANFTDTDVWREWDVTNMLKDALNDSLTYVDVMVLDSDETGSGDRYASFYTKESASNKPELVITYIEKAYCKATYQFGTNPETDIAEFTSISSAYEEKSWSGTITGGNNESLQLRVYLKAENGKSTVYLKEPYFQINASEYRRDLG